MIFKVILMRPFGSKVVFVEAADKDALMQNRSLIEAEYKGEGLVSIVEVARAMEVKVYDPIIFKIH